MNLEERSTNVASAAGSTQISSPSQPPSSDLGASATRASKKNSTTDPEEVQQLIGMSFVDAKGVSYNSNLFS
jgi:hypothetical protein